MFELLSLFPPSVPRVASRSLSGKNKVHPYIQLSPRFSFSLLTREPLTNLINFFLPLSFPETVWNFSYPFFFRSMDNREEGETPFGIWICNVTCYSLRFPCGTQKTKNEQEKKKTAKKKTPHLTEQVSWALRYSYLFPLRKHSLWHRLCNG